MYYQNGNTLTEKPCPRNYEIYSFGRSTSAWWQGVENKIFKEMMHFHNQYWYALTQELLSQWSWNLQFCQTLHWSSLLQTIKKNWQVVFKKLNCSNVYGRQTGTNHNRSLEWLGLPKTCRHKYCLKKWLNEIKFQVPVPVHVAI